ncbi:CotH kinase family protein [Loigolactobacillus zhaoyuanensis]|uniref:CotH kinase family protein n=2 Tax=Loigolactobacillus zhaoyuanensis TaxID=2486017 RepID=UPI000F74834B
MTGSDYDVYVNNMLAVNYEAAIDQTARFDGLYPGMIWPYNHGGVAGNHDARPLHGTQIHVTREATLNTGMTFAEFNWHGKDVWIPKDGIIPPTLTAKIQLTNQLATLMKPEIDYPYFKAVPQTKGRNHIPLGYITKNRLAGQKVLVTAQAIRSDNAEFTQFYVNGVSFWVSAQVVSNLGQPLPTLFIGSNPVIRANTKSKSSTVTIRQATGESDLAQIKFSVQGNYTKDFQRKNFEFELYADFEQATPKPIQFGTWQPRSKFSLRGDYTDQTHSRNGAGYALWREILATEQVYPTTIRDQEMLGTIQTQPVNVFFDGVNYGIYSLSSYLDAASLKLDPHNKDEIMLLALNGYAHNKDLAFANPTARLNDSDFGVMSAHTAADQQLFTNTNRLMKFINTADDQEFHENAKDYFDPLNLIDYILFVGAIDAFDNVAHNTTVFTYDGQHWLFSLIDLDISFDIDADGKLLSNPHPVFNKIQSPLFKRIFACFPSEVKARWQELRHSVLSEDHMIDTYRQTMAKIGDTNFAIDQSIWHSPTGRTSSLEHVTTFVQQHLPKSDDTIAKSYHRNLLQGFDIDFK